MIKTEKKLGEDKEGNKIYAIETRYGPSVKKEINGRFVYAKIEKPLTLENITLKDAIELLSFQKLLGQYENKDIFLKKGPYGPYLSYDGANYAFPKDTGENISLEGAIKIIKEKFSPKIITSIKEKKLDKNNITVVMYHDPCADGKGSAFIVWYYFKINFGIERANQIKYIPCYYLKENDNVSEKIMDEIQNQNIIMCDFSYKLPQLEKIIDISNQFMILDHHKTSEAALKKIPNNLKIFDMNLSGVGITWKYFFPNEALPTFLALIQDRDIWKYEYNDTNDFITYFYEQDLSFEEWESYLEDDTLKTAISTGRSWNKYKNIIMNNILKKKSYIIQKIDNRYVIVLYLNSSILKSDIGNRLFSLAPIGDFSVVYDYDLFRNQTLCSLRSTNNRMDVSTIAKKFGGGGHRNASGIVLKGLHGMLPFERIEDPGLLELLFHKEVHKSKKQTFTLFKITEFREEWLKYEYLELIKKKCSDSNYLVFQKKSDKVGHDNETNEIIELNDYIVMHNENSLTKEEDILAFKTINKSDCLLEFTTDKEFIDCLNIITGSLLSKMKKNKNFSSENLEKILKSPETIEI